MLAAWALKNFTGKKGTGFAKLCRFARSIELLVCFATAFCSSARGFSELVHVLWFFRYFFDSWTCWRTCWESCLHLNHWTHVLPRSACKSAYYAFNAIAIAGFAFFLVCFLLNAYCNMAFDWVAYFPLISWTFCLSLGTVEWTLVTRWLIWSQSWPFRVWQI